MWTRNSYRFMCVVLTVGLVCSCFAFAKLRAHERKRLRAEIQTTSQFAPIQLVEAHRCDDETGHAAVVGLLKVVGAGDASLLGPMIDEQSHCIRADFTFFNGHFTLTNAAGQTIRGRYFGQLSPTFNSTFPDNAPPGGQWLVLGNVCIEGGTIGRIENDCRNSRYGPARGITNLGTGDATVFLDQLIGVEPRE